MKKRHHLVLVFSLMSIGVMIWLLLDVMKPKPAVHGEFGAYIPSEYPILGMDISHYQETIDWQAVSKMSVADDSIQFVYIKATEGLTLEDRNKRQNAVGARSVDISYGFYHFYIPSLSATEQAHFFCDETGGYNFELRPVIDIESETSFSVQQLNDSINVFIDIVQSRLNTRPIIYTYSKFFKDYFTESEEDFWIARYGNRCPEMELDNVLCWQFSERGTVSGIDNYVDLNVAKDNFEVRMRR